MKRLIYLLLAVSLGLNAGLLVTRYSREVDRRDPRGPGPGPGLQAHQPADPERILDGHVRAMTRHLELTSEQQDAVRDALRSHMPRLTDLQRRIRDLENELSEIYAARTLDQDRFWELVRVTSAARAERDSLSAMMLIAEAEVLTPEQRAKFAEVAILVHSDPERVPPRGEGPPPPDGSGHPPERGALPRDQGNRPQGP